MEGAEGILQDWARGAGSLSMHCLRHAAPPVALAISRPLLKLRGHGLVRARGRKVSLAHHAGPEWLRAKETPRQLLGSSANTASSTGHHDPNSALLFVFSDGASLIHMLSCLRAQLEVNEGVGSALQGPITSLPGWIRPKSGILEGKAASDDTDG